MIGGQICQQITGMKENPTEGHRFDCNGDASKRTGKVVRLENYYQRLIICEIEIFGKKYITKFLYLDYPLLVYQKTIRFCSICSKQYLNSQNPK